MATDDYRKMFDDRLLKAWDLDGKDVTVTIEAVEAEELNNGTKTNRKPVLTLAKTAKKFVVNKTNGITIAQMYGKAVSEWRGKRITIFATTTKFGKDIVDCIRVRPQIPGSKPAQEPQS